MENSTTSAREGDLSPRQVSLRYGFNTRAVTELIREGALALRGRKVTSESLGSLIEGVHYVRCRECGAFAATIHPTHLKTCSGLTPDEYLARHPGAPTMSERNRARKAKSPAQREAQSRKLRERFQTPEGGETRRQISEAAKRMQASDAGQRCKAALRNSNADPAMKARRGASMKTRWESGPLRGLVQDWHRNNPEASQEGAFNARRHVLRKFTGLHRRFKALMEGSGLEGFVTEYEVGYYSIDEARADLKVAVEIDGCYWHACPQCGFDGPLEGRHSDRSKTTYLESRGWAILRVWEHEINRDPMGCLGRLRQLIEAQETKNHAGR